MRPHLLKFGGIGAYPGDVQVNFDDLSKKGLYLVVGPTGAGKTTIFDAMTFALYGKTASNREGMFVSDHANRVDPYVELSFSHQGRNFVVRREPHRDKNKNAIPSKQWFREVDVAGNALRTETGSKSATSEVNDLLGLDADQFMQVILLPQNKFQEFLMAKSSERKPLLQKIFGTGLYSRIALHLKETAARLQEEAEEIKQKLEQQFAVQHAIVDSLEEQDYFESLEGLELENLIETLTSAANKLSTATEDLNAKYEEALKIQTRAKSEVDRFDAAQEKAELDKEQKTSEPKVVIARSQIAENERARRVVEISEELATLERGAEESRITAEKVRADLKDGLGKLTISPETSRTLFEALPTASAKTLSTEVANIQKKVTVAVEAFTELESLQSDTTSLGKDIDAAEKTIKALKATLEKASSRLSKEKAELKEANSAEKKLAPLRKKLDDIDDLHDAADVDGCTARLLSASKALEKAQKSFNDAEALLDKARINRTLHLAGELATTLAADHECPVCGSTSHPKKAKKTSDTDISSLEKKRDKAQEKKVEAETLVTETQKALADAQTAQKKLPSKKDEDAMRKQFDELESKADSADDLSEAIEETNAEIEGVKEEIVEKELQLKGDRTELKQKTERAAVLVPISTSLGSERAAKDADSILEMASGLIDDLENLNQQASEDETKKKEAEKRLKASLSTENFASAEAARESCLDQGTEDALAVLIQEYESRAARILVLTGTIGKEPVPKSRPAMEEVAEAVALAKEAFEASASSLNSTKDAIGTLQTAADTIAKLGPTSAEKVERANSATALARVVERGAGSGDNQQLGLEEWVQRTLFEEVCIVATAQMRQLFSNRYVLTLDADGAKKKSHAGGLELYVLDSQNGQARSVHTLSGGEQFLTSLALALALAEVVERHSGGMELSTLFIDEGFGSLDGNTLDTAMDVLTKLQDSGRTVGIISHVEAMQDRLPTGLRVNKTNSGSTLEVL
jgi:exonuclease SbcC